MSNPTSMSASRREFMKRVSALSVTGAAAPLALNLAAFGSAAAASATDYKALVCIFLNGGNDSFNTLVPYDAQSHAMYAKLRVPGMVHARSALNETALAALPGGRQYALNPSMKGLVPLFNQGQLAVQLNVGTLIEPVSKQAWVNKSVRLPKALFAHNTQRALWSMGKNRDGGRPVGWAGRMGDLFMADNNKSMFTAVTISGDQALLSGNDTRAYTLPASGVRGLNALGNPDFGHLAPALRELITYPRPNFLKDAYQRVVTQSLAAEASLRSTLLPESAIAAAFPDNALGHQLKMVARMVASAPSLGLKRQVFFVSMDGFDLHDAFGRHDGMLRAFSSAMASFYRATVALGVSDKVTAFTASDFGRALQSNSDGTDHGWGADHFILGGAVNGARFYGKAPELASNGPDDVGQGRLIPSTALDQYAATLGRWFGLSQNQLVDILPNLANFPIPRAGMPSFV